MYTLKVNQRMSRLFRSSTCMTKTSPRGASYLGVRNIWHAMLMPLNNDIPEGVIRTLIHISMGDENNMKTTQSIVSFFGENERVPELINYIVKREVVSNIDSPEYIFHSNSSFEIFAKMFYLKESDAFLEYVANQIVLKIRKSRIRFINETKHIVKDVKKIVKLLDDLLTLVSDTTKYSRPSKYLLYQILKVTFYDYPLENSLAMEAFVFDCVIKKLRTTITKNANEKMTIDTFINVVNWYISPSEVEWGPLYQMKLASFRDRIRQWKQHVLEFEPGREDALVRWFVTTDGFVEKLVSMVWYIEEFVGEESKKLLNLHFGTGDNVPSFKKAVKEIANEVEGLRRTADTEKHQMLQMMSTIQMKHKDMNEEIRYLDELLNAGKASEHKTEEEIDESLTALSREKSEASLDTVPMSQECIADDFLSFQ
ncbi:hypothetical protein EIN_056220 [Entamoeba invadens IP1]|uniref:hypothetical protein n=1 Tax=Entamoeba invadens IP1 TaxID=370355 RepID=UPI0002C3DD09|nr:hypothetical protein EIN_056220 [Entamoeba invadens IP1]ELP93247.1 hypothetical protein EIN_056220 [Entamoeba invadens IP1]|eukprot:XP_004260018.1 hypothetical protein EIN_056220 [Entamoeba invadens IP1]